MLQAVHLLEQVVVVLVLLVQITQLVLVQQEVLEQLLQ
jgi:hypothetical protein